MKIAKEESRRVFWIGYFKYLTTVKVMKTPEGQRWGKLMHLTSGKLSSQKS